MPETRQPERLAPRATSNRHGGRDHLGILGEIKSVHPGEIVGIRKLRYTGDIPRLNCPPFEGFYPLRGGKLVPCKKDARIKRLEFVAQDRVPYTLEAIEGEGRATERNTSPIISIMAKGRRDLESHLLLVLMVPEPQAEETFFRGV